MNERQEPMTAEEARPYLVEYLDGELEEPLRSRIESLIAEDPELGEEVASLRETWATLDLDKTPATSPDFVASTLDRLHARHRTNRLTMRTVLAVAAVLLLAIGGWLVFGSGGSSGPISDVELAENLELLEDLELLEELGEEIELLALLENEAEGEEWGGSW